MKTRPRPIRMEMEQKVKPKYNLLIAEDEEINFYLLETFLSKIEEADFNLIRAENGEEAVELCLATPDLDLVLMDIKMPIMDGFEAIQEIRPRFAELPIVVQTAFVTEADKEKALEVGCTAFVRKPLKRELLWETLKELLEK